MRRSVGALAGVALGVMTACGGGGGGGGSGGGGTSVFLELYNTPYAMSPSNCQPEFMFPPESIVAFEIIASGTGKSVAGEIPLSRPEAPGGSGYFTTISLPAPGLYRLRAMFSSGVRSPACDGAFAYADGDSGVSAVVKTPVH